MTVPTRSFLTFFSSSRSRMMRAPAVASTTRTSPIRSTTGMSSRFSCVVRVSLNQMSTGLSAKSVLSPTMSPSLIKRFILSFFLLYIYLVKMLDESRLISGFVGIYIYLVKHVEESLIRKLEHIRLVLRCCRPSFQRLKGGLSDDFSR
jgi:hypothetical protein